MPKNFNGTDWSILADHVAPFDPTKPGFSWPDAVLWAIAGGIGLAIAKMTSAWLTAIGWKAVTGTPPPGQVEEPKVI